MILEIILITFVHYYFNNNVERILTNQAELSASFFHQYFDAEDLEQQSERLLKGFSENSNAQVQIIQANGTLLQSTTGERIGEILNDFEDVQEASLGKVGIWRGFDDSTHEALLAVSYPLKSQETTVGVVRFVTSLTETIKTINYISAIFISIGLFVLAIVAVLGVLVSRTITGSIKELKIAAEKMAEGDFAVTIKKRYRDELGTLADTLNMMASKIRRNEKLKNDFISSISHELRTPLTSIKGWAVTLKSDGGNGKLLLEDGLDIIETESDRLTCLVDELLDLSKLDNGRMELYCTPLHLNELLEHIRKQLAPRAARQRVSLDVHVDRHMPVIHADENRLKQVLINLLDNSLKFTSSGGIINVNAQVDKALRQVIISVEDTGSGIAEQELNNVFQMFYKGNNNQAGSGLGLSISRQIINLHHGEMKLYSQFGKGTKIEIYLPV
nr:ATP-binding protein [Paenibacillus castaneae]